MFDLFPLITLLLFHSVCANQTLPTYFQYTQSQYNQLKNMSSKYNMVTEQLTKSDQIMFDLVEKNKLGGLKACKIYTYVYTAQRDAGFLSKNINGRFIGSLEPVSSEALCLFFPKDCQSIQTKFISDPYSDKLAKIVILKIKKRILLDKNRTKMYPELTGKQYWAGKLPYIGQDAGSAMPWLIASPKAFLPPAPPAVQSNEWSIQLKKTTTAAKGITAKQRKMVIDWAGDPATITTPGMWLDMANRYMASQNVTLAKRLLTRSVLAMGIDDSLIAVFHAKYIFWTKRPFMLDPTLHTIIPTPNHPSYPSGHSALSATAATILSYYFPQNAKQWWQQAQDASDSRILGGIHFPLDTQQGLTMGKKIGKYVIDKSLDRSPGS